MVSRKNLARGVLAILAGAVISLVVLFLPIDYGRLGVYGYLGVFAVTLLATGGLFLPVPYMAMIFRASSDLNPVILAVVAGAASGLGELTGYLLGIGGKYLLEEHPWRRRAEAWMRRFGFPSVVVLAFVPNPFFDVVGVLAGAVGLPVWQFALAAFIGKSLRFLLISELGNHWLS